MHRYLEPILFNQTLVDGTSPADDYIVTFNNNYSSMWLYYENVSAAVATTTFDIQARVSATSPWFDLVDTADTAVQGPVVAWVMNDPSNMAAPGGFAAHLLTFGPIQAIRFVIGDANHEVAITGGAWRAPVYTA